MPDSTSGSNAHDYAYTYDSNDNRLTSTETRGLLTSTYDAANRLTTTIEGVSITTYSYDRNGSLNQVTEMDGTVYTYGTDAEFRLNWQKKNGEIAATWVYDAVGRLAKYDVGNGPVTVLWDGETYFQERS